MDRWDACTSATGVRKYDLCARELACHAITIVIISILIITIMKFLLLGPALPTALHKHMCLSVGKMKGRLLSSVNLCRVSCKGRHMEGCCLAGVICTCCCHAVIRAHCVSFQAADASSHVMFSTLQLGCVNMYDWSSCNAKVMNPVCRQR